MATKHVLDLLAVYEACNEENNKLYVKKLECLFLAPKTPVFILSEVLYK